jgi:uncharacterized protein (TIGR00297 family)
VIERALAGFVLAGALAFAARAARALSLSGALAAVVVGTAAALAGWGWAILLIVFFVLSSALSRFRRATREARIAGIVEKSDQRDAFQVFANGGVFAAAAVVGTVTGNPLWGVAALGSLAAAAGDTWATEIGTLAGGVPRSIVSLRPLPAGTSGGITLAGTVSSLAGTGAVVLVAQLTGLGMAPGAVFLGGLAGSLADSLVGATVQERRWCDACSQATERRVHSCKQPTRVIGGVPGARNDFVNVVCTMVGAIVAAVAAR